MSMRTSSTYDKGSILLGFAEALSAPEVVWSLIDNGFSVVVYSRREAKTPLRRCKKIKIIELCPPEIDVNQSVNDLKDIVDLINPKILMPLDDKSVWLCNKIASGSTNIKIAGATGTQAQLALNKRLQIEAAARAGLRIIPTQHVHNHQELNKIKEFPVLLKPTTAIVASDKQLLFGPHYRCADRSELMSVTQSWDGSYPMLAQPIINGIGEGIFGFATDNGVKAWSAHRRIRMMNPHGSGSSACESSPILDQPCGLIERMLTEIKWSGIFMVEFIRDKSNRLWFMEMNGRPWGSMALARRGGYEYPFWAVSYALDPHFKPELPNTYKTVVCRHLGREIVHILMVLRGPQSSTASTWPSFGKTLLDVLQIKRNHSWYNWHAGDALFFLEDAYRTVLNTIKKR